MRKTTILGITAALGLSAAGLVFGPEQITLTNPLATTRGAESPLADVPSDAPLDGQEAMPEATPTPRFTPEPNAAEVPSSPRQGTASSVQEAYEQSTAGAVRVNVGTSGVGSGFFLTGDGLVLTAAHVVLGGEGPITVTTDDGVAHPAEIVGYDETRDLALLRASGSDFEALPLAASAPSVGDPVVAIGNSRGAFDGGRAGRVTALNASLDATFPSGLVASSMPLAPGDSGGPVLNARGEVVGVSTAISMSDGRFSSYFVPVTSTSAILNDLRAGAKRGVPVLGVNVADAREATGEAGALVAGVTPGFGAQKAGLRAAVTREYLDETGRAQTRVVNADVIVAVDGRAVRSPSDLVTYLRTKRAGDDVRLTLKRDGKTVQVTVRLMERGAV